MACLATGPYLPDLEATRLMEVPEAPRPQAHSLFARRTSFSSWLFGAPYICHQLRVHKVRFTLGVASYNSLVKSAVMSVDKGKSTTHHKGLCKVIWTIEADLRDGQHLYITGDPNALGCWEPEVAMLMSPTKHFSLWKAEVKIACGTSFKYNYFIKENTQPSCNIIWRPGPEYSLSVPLLSKRDRKIVVRDSWMRFKAQRHPVPLWGSWMEEAILPELPVALASAKDEDELSENLRADPFEVQKLFENLQVKDDLSFINNQGQESNRPLSDENQPIEEPWLLHSSLSLNIPIDRRGSEVSETKVLESDEVIQSQLYNQHLRDMEKLLPEEVDSKISLDEPISTVILINSSICTMQRIAILEDDKLVELLLEPVKNNVQCDSVYVGVVTKLVPHMGGAFINIGSFRPSLMDIKHNREPFIFPPFRCRTNKKEVDSFMFSMQREHISHDDVDLSDDLAEADFQDDPVQDLDNDVEERESKNDFYAPEVIKKYLNGSVANNSLADADFESCPDLTDQLVQDVTDTDLCSVATEVPIDSQSLKDPVNTFNVNKWSQVQKGTKIIVQVVKEGLGTKGPTLSAYPKLRSRFWILSTRCDRIGVSKKISGAERTRLRVIAKNLQPRGFGLTVRTVAAGHSLDELQNDLEGLLLTWKSVMEHAKSAALAADEGIEGAVPVILHRAMGQTLSVVQDYFSEKVKRMVVDSPRTFHEVTNYLQEIAPNLCDRVELHNKRIPLFDEFNIEDEINNILNKRVSLANGGSLVIEQTEALVSIDVNGGHGMFRQGTSQEKAVLDVNLAAAKQIARELRLRDIGGIIVVDFIDMIDDSNKRLVYEEVKKAVERDRSLVKVSELSKHGLMEITRKRVRPSVTFMISEPCTCCHSTGRVEAVETSFSKIEHEICRLLATVDQKPDPENPKSWPRVVLRVDHHMCNYLISGKKTRLATLSSSLKVWILLKVARGFNRGTFEVKPFTEGKMNSNQHQVSISMMRSSEVGTYSSSRKLTLFPVKKSKTREK